jgi:hypothetical protein
MPRIGIEGRLYYGAAEAQADTPAENIRDLTLDLKADEVDASTRAHGGYKAYLRGLKDCSVDWKMNADGSDAFYQALRNSFTEGTAIALAVLDEEGGAGIDADFQVISCPRAEPNSGVMEITIAVKPHADTDRTVEWTATGPSDPV